MHSARRPTVIESGLRLAAMAVLCAAASDIWAQLPRPIQLPGRQLRVFGQRAQPSNEGELAEHVFLPPDRRTLQQLSDARKLIDESRFGEATRYLGAILSNREDFFFQPDRTSPTYRSVRAEAQRIVGQMPPKGRESYELQYGAQAKRALEDALAAGDIAAVADVARQFYHTRAGYQAALLLGLHHFEHGRPLAAALTLARLREATPYTDDFEPRLSLTAAACWYHADMVDQARQCLLLLRRQQPTLRVAVAGREVPIFAEGADPIPWLTSIIGSRPGSEATAGDTWLLVGGNAARNARSTGGIPLLNMRWRVTVMDDPVLENELQQYQRLCVEQNTPLLPTLYPLAVADVLLMRTSRNLLAVDIPTGKRLWEISEPSRNDAAPVVQIGDSQSQRSMLSAGLRQRLCGDLTYGSLSSDGRLVFAIEDLELGMGLGQPGAVILRQGAIGGNPVIGVATDGDQSTLVNRLAAYDIRSGKLTWQLGGHGGARALRQAGTFFLGPPLPLFGQLYVLGEIKGEIRLMAVEAATGSVLWSQQLAVAEQAVGQDAWRRYAGTSPSYADGVLVCPTSAGAIVGVELATRSLLWGYRYGRNANANRHNAMMSGVPASSRWADGNVTIVDGRVISTPIESDHLYCSSLVDGEMLWQTPRQDDLYVACADRDRVVLVGPNSVRALRMADGKPAWGGRTVRLPGNSMPSGRGFLAGDRYCLPLNNADVAAIDVGAGKVAQVARSWKGDATGNLMCYQGKMISQSFNGVDAYYQLDAAAANAKRRLAAKPDDAEALALQGEVLLDAGNRSEAIACFRRAYALEPDPRTRELLRDSLMQGMERDFAAYRDGASEVERLLDDPAQQAAYLRLMAEGLRKTGRWVDAFDYYQRLIDLEPDHRPLDKLSGSLSVRRDRWVVGQLSLLRSEADKDSAAKIDAVVVKRLKAAIGDGSIERLQRLLDYFGGQPAATAARDELVARLTRAKRLLEAEIVGAMWGSRSDSPAVNTAPRQTAKEPADWPVGRIEVTKRVSQSAAPLPRYLIAVRGSASDLAIRFDESTRTLVGSDGYGRPQWRVALSNDSKRPSLVYNRMLSHARTQGHLLLVALGTKIIAIDTLGTGGTVEPRVLWSQELMTTGAMFATVNSFPMAFGNVPWQWQQQFVQSHGPSNVVGPLTSQSVCLQRSRKLTAVDLRSGDTLWCRDDVPTGSDVFGDDEYLFVLSPDSEDAMLLRAVDGQRLGSRKLPRLRGRQVFPGGEERTGFGRLDTACLTTLGRRLLLWWPEGDQRVLTLVDPLEGRDLWPERRFSMAARSCVLGQEAVGVLEPNIVHGSVRKSRFLLLGLPDGRTIADVLLESERGLTDINLISSGDQYFLIAQSVPLTGNTPNIQPLIGSGYTPIYQGKMYAFDQQGRLQWPRPATVENQFLLREQPKRLPIITFACQQYQQNIMASGLKTSVLCIDKRNGRTAYKGDFANGSGAVDVVGDRDKKTVDLVLQRNSVIRLAFTDKPLPAGAENESEVKKTPGGEAAQALWDSMRDAFDRLMRGLNEDGEE